MRILVVGSGGREHALAWRFQRDGHEVFACPGNPGIGLVAEICSSSPLEAAQSRDVELVVVGPEAPLIDGLADRLRAAGYLVAGPGREGAMLEASKAFSKQVMAEAGIPTALWRRVETVADGMEMAERCLAEFGGVAVKASGAALGKGVVVCATREEADSALRMMLEEGAFGEAGRTVVVEERLVGPEFSLLTLAAGERFHSLPIAQDHKSIFDGGRGPNTGGMGAYSPAPSIPDSIIRQAEEEAVRPALRRLAERGIDYRGVLFSGFMIHDGRPRCLEFNVRFGDPETQAILPRLGPGLAEALLACARDEEIPPPPVLDLSCVAVALASRGYPEGSEKGRPITLPEPGRDEALFHSGTALQDGRLMTAGGRVIAAAAWRSGLEEARLAAYALAQRITFSGRQMRSDIALLA